MDILTDMLKQIDQGITDFNIDQNEIPEIKKLMNEFNSTLPQRLIFFTIVDDRYFSMLFKEFCESDYQWSLIQHCSSHFHHKFSEIKIDYVKPSKLVDLTSSNMYLYLLIHILKNDEVIPEHFINYYVNIDDPDSLVIWQVINYALTYYDSYHQLDIAIKLSKLKELVIPDYREHTPFDYVSNFKEITKQFYKSDVNDIVDEFTISIFAEQNERKKSTNNKTFNICDVNAEIIHSIIQIFDKLNLPRQITFVNNLFNWMSKDKIFYYLVSTDNESFINYLWDILQVDELFNKYFIDVDDLSKCFCLKIIQTYPYYSDKILIKLSTNTNILKSVFPDIKGYEIIQAFERFRAT